METSCNLLRIGFGHDRCSNEWSCVETMFVEIPAKMFARMANTRGFAVMREHRFVMRDCIIGDHVAGIWFVSVNDCLLVAKVDRKIRALP